MLESSSDSAALTQGGLAALQAIYRQCFNFAKAEVMLMDLSSTNRHQYSLDLCPEDDASRWCWMSAMEGSIAGLDGVM
jgi:hypothetical protein